MRTNLLFCGERSGGIDCPAARPGSFDKLLLSKLAEVVLDYGLDRLESFTRDEPMGHGDEALVDQRLACLGTD